MKDAMSAIIERRSVRKFKNDAVPGEIITRILEAGRWAPSAGNLQPWEFYVVYNGEKKDELVQAAYNQRFIGEAPVVIVVCAFPEKTVGRYQERGEKLYVIQDTAAASQNILIAASGMGLGSCWVGAFNEEKVKEVLGIPSRPVAIIPIGYVDEKPHASTRLPFEEVVHIIY